MYDDERMLGTPLHVACSKNYIEIAKLLLTKVSVNIGEESQAITPLFFAAICGYTELAKILLEHGAKTNIAVDEGGENDYYYYHTPLHCAAVNGHNEVVKLLLARPETNNNANCFGITPLYLACKSGYLDVVKTLCLHGADVNLARNNIAILGKEEKSKDGENLGATPFFIAAKNHQYEVIKFLLTQENVNVDAKISTGETALTVLNNSSATLIEEIEKYKEQSQKVRMAKISNYKARKTVQLNNDSENSSKFFKHHQKIKIAEKLEKGSVLDQSDIAMINKSKTLSKIYQR